MATEQTPPPHIRFAHAEDAPGIQAIYAPVVTDSVTSFELEPPDVAEIKRRMNEHAGVLPWLVCEIENEVAGYAYAGPHRSRWAYQWSVEVSVYVAAEHRRRAVGSSLYTALLELLTRQGYARAFAGITMPNEASVGLHTATGFEAVGTYRDVGYKDGAWHDVSWWQRPLRDWGEQAPSPPRPITELQAAGETEETLSLGTAGLRS